jgi:RHS repeat-associated protein
MRAKRPSSPDYSRLKGFDCFITTPFIQPYGRRVPDPRAKRRLRESAGIPRRRALRMLVCLAITLNMLIWPSPDITIRPVIDPMSVVASTVSSSALTAGINLASALREFRDAPPVVMIKLGPMVMPVPVFPLWFQSSTPRELTMLERTSRAVDVTLSPHRFVGYIGDTVTFIAKGTTADGKPAHGAKFSFESSDESKLTIDEAGRATLLAAGTVAVIARAAAAIKAAPVLIRSTRRRVQTDAEWRADQDSLVASSDRESLGESGIGTLLGAIGDRLIPSAHAQGGGQGLDYGNAAPIGQVGTPPFAALEETRLGPVMPQTNFELPISLVDLGGRGLATSLMAYYNSNTWGAYVDGSFATHYVFDPIQGWPSPGFSLGFGRIVIYNGYYDPGLGDTVYTFMLVAANGTRHQLGTGTSMGTNALQTTDGSHITYAGNALGGTVYYQDGSKMTIGLVNNRRLPTQITDTNGNYIQIAYRWETNYPGIAINYIVDTLGRVITFNYGEWPAPPGSTLLTSISTPAGSVTFSYQAVTMNYNFLNQPIVENAPATFSAVTNITIPAKPTYNFSYSGYGMIYSTSAVSGGGTATVAYNYPLGGEEIIGQPTFTQRTETPSTPTAIYTYGSDITRPNGTKLSLSSTVRELKNNSNQTLSKIEYTFTTDPGGSTAIQSIVTTDEAQPGQQTKVDFDYDAFGNVVNEREYGFKINGQWQVRRRTHSSYISWEPYISQYIRNRTTEVDVYDALQNNNEADDVLIGKTTFSYDNPLNGMEGYGGTANPPGHLSNYDTTKSTRGNVTGVTKYSDLGGAGVTRSSKTDIFGGVTLAQVDCCYQKSFTMTEATYWSKPSQTTSGNTSGIYLTSSAVYNFNTLTTTSNTDPNNQTTSYSYDAAQRRTGFASPTGATGSTSYNALSEAASTSVTWNEGGTNKTITQTATYDGWGQMVSSVDGSGAQTNYTYNNMGLMITRTNPFPQGGTPGPVTTYVYDLLGRNTLITLPGGNTVQTNYTNSTIVTVTDQVNRKIKRESDGLGRLIKVTEQDVSTGNLTQETTYSYDIADRLIGVNQGNQTRAFKYDAEGQLLFERIPEQTATINDGTGTYWSCKYTYTDWGAFSTKQDARGVITTYGYDTLHRLISINYNTSGAPGVATTANMTYTFDNSEPSTTKGLLLSLAVGTGYSESYSYDSFKRVQSVTRTIDGRNYTTNYQLNTVNQTTQLTYASGRVLNASYDASARLTSLAQANGPTYISNFAYDVNGNPTAWTLGNGVREGFAYDANRLQPTLHTAGTTSPYTNLMNLTYGYQAAAGQMGSNTTPGNAGQLISISGTVNGTTESAAYTFDNLGRLATSNQSSSGSTAQRRFAHDRWGNRTGVWDAISGGNQIQSITLQQSGGVPTNRIQSVTAGSTVNYTYDSAGNVTNDGGHSYTYDAVNRIVSVDGGTTASYAYDQSNQRYKKVTGGSTTHYIWHGAEVIAEHNGSTGAVLTDLIYSDGRIIATIASGVTRYAVNDRMSARITLDVSGNVLGRQGHLPFGDDFAESGSQEKHHFTSYERDAETGNDYAVNRSYSAIVGRFLSADPYRTSGGTGDPRSWNRYSFTRNVAINRGDPLGLFDRPIEGPIEAGCPPVGTPGTWLGKCLCQVVPMHCDIRRPPPNVDGHSGGVGDPKIRFGGLKVDGQCQRCLYVPEDLPARWIDPPRDQNLTADAVATPRGAVKIPDLCSCEVFCSNGHDYRIECQCQNLLFNPAPKIIPIDKIGPRKEWPALPGDWAFDGRPYTRTQAIPPGGVTLPVLFYVFD